MSTPRPGGDSRANGPQPSLAEADPTAVREARRLVAEISHIKAPVRLLGGLAVRLRRPPSQEGLFPRHFEDIDLIARGMSPKQISALANAMGYVADRQFNALNGSRRQIFYTDSGLKVEVFVNEFAMCHRIPMDRALLEPETIPLAELLVTKLQIVNLTQKDLHDTFELLNGFSVASMDDQFINGDRIAEFCAVDWGLWRTATGNLAKVQRLVPESGLSEVQQSKISDHAAAVRSHIDHGAKSTRWKLRARLGDRLPWYEEPDEV